MSIITIGLGDDYRAVTRNLNKEADARSNNRHEYSEKRVKGIRRGIDKAKVDLLREYLDATKIVVVYTLGGQED